MGYVLGIYLTFIVYFHYAQAEHNVIPDSRKEFFCACVSLFS